MAYVLDGEPASTSPEYALVLIGSLGARIRSGSKAVLTASERDFWSTPNNGHHQTGTAGPFRAMSGSERIHSITSSASASKVGGTTMPSAFAVFRLTTRSNFSGRCIGKSFGLAPCRIFPT